MKEREEHNSLLKKEVSDLKKQLKIVTEKLDYIKDKHLFIVGKTIHNLKNPVGISSSFSEMMLEDLDIYTPEKLKKHLTVIKSSCDFSLDLLDNLQYISKLESGKAPLNLTVQNYCKLVEKSFKEQQLLANKRSIEIELSIEIENCKLVIDTIEVKQVLDIIINNAHRYSAEHSKVLIKIFEEEDAILTTVTDEGIGLEEAHLAAIFDEFKVIRTFSESGEKCLGLGLTIAKEIIEQHCGKITVSSTFGQGSTFTILLPKTNNQMN